MTPLLIPFTSKYNHIYIHSIILFFYSVERDPGFSEVIPFHLWLSQVTGRKFSNFKWLSALSYLYREQNPRKIKMYYYYKALSITHCLLPSARDLMTTSASLTLSFPRACDWLTAVPNTLSPSPFTKTELIFIWL